MRIVPLAVVFFCCAAAGAAEPKSDREQDKSRYVIECRQTTTAEGGTRTVLMAPAISVNEGVPATIKDVTQTPFATGIVSPGGRDESRVTVLEEGTTIELTVFGDRRGWVTVDANIATSQVTGLEIKEVGRNDHRQCPQTESRTVRIIKAVKMGEVFAVEAKVPEGALQRTIELLVRTPSMPRQWQVPKKEPNVVRDAQPPNPYSDGSARNDLRPRE